MSAEYNAKFANTAVATRAIHAGQEPDPTTGAVVTPIYATSTFKQDGVLGLRGGHDYSRSINPTRTSFDEQLAAVEGAKYALSFSSGLAAIDVLLRSTIKPGDNILLGNDVYGGTYRLLSKVFVPWGVGLDVVDITDTAAVEAALAAKSYKYVWVETRPTRCSTSPTSQSPPKWPISTAPRWQSTIPSLRPPCSTRSMMVPMRWSTPPPSTSAATPMWSAVPWCSTMRKPVSRWPSCRTQPVPCLPRSIRSLTFAA